MISLKKGCKICFFCSVDTGTSARCSIFPSVNLDAQAEYRTPLAVGGQQQYRVPEGLDQARVEPALAEHVHLLLQLVADELVPEVLLVESIHRLNRKVEREEDVFLEQGRGRA
jgi:hypothetical protein